MKSLGRACYEGYYDHTGGVSIVSGERLPQWDQLSDAIKAAWEAAALAVIAGS